MAYFLLLLLFQQKEVWWKGFSEAAEVWYLKANFQLRTRVSLKAAEKVIIQIPPFVEGWKFAPKFYIAPFKGNR